ncbi:MAG: TerB family tellurite resistance protein [Cyclobacteriaceae bacterium]|nr:TerB family tellurite resistance protein [Cyclobacteriaceae bacterium]
MKPSNKGWLSEYLDFRKDLFNEPADYRKDSHPEYALYRIIQPTGLMYGQSVGNINHPDAASWDEKDRMKVLLAESLISSSILFHGKSITSQQELAGLFTRVLENITAFYNTIFPELATPTKTLFGKKRSTVELAERILEKRIDRTFEHRGNFWVYFFHNSILFLDIFIFGQWIHTNADKIVADFFRYEREELRFSVIKVIAAAAHSDNVLDFEEQKLFEYFIQGTEIPAERRKEALSIFKSGVAVQDINLPADNSWILRKFYLEVAILTMWADRRVEDSEHEFLKRLCTHMGFTEDDLENSLIAIEGFVLEHWEELEYLQDKQNYERVSEHFISRVARIADKNRGRLLKEIQDNKLVINLLQKAKAEELTADESQAVRLHLIRALKTIPTFAIIALPENFLTLPVLLKILPKNLFTGQS